VRLICSSYVHFLHVNGLEARGDGQSHKRHLCLLESFENVTNRVWFLENAACIVGDVGKARWRLIFCGIPFCGRAVLTDAESNISAGASGTTIILLMR